MNASTEQNNQIGISWDVLHTLEERYGDSFYLLDCEAFRQNYRQLLEAFQSIYPHTNIAYSYKTNYTPRLCQLVDQMGGYAEVVSGLEYELALKIGVLPRRIIFNGPCKREDEIATALLAGSIVNLDSMHEVELVEALAKRSSASDLTVGLRCNFGLDTGKVSRFGLDVDRGELEAALQILRHAKHCKVAGLHCHFSTSHKSADSYARRTRRMLELLASVLSEASPRFLDIGGGFFGKMNPDLQAQFPVQAPSYQDYATAIATQLAEAYPDGTGPELILEPGTAIAADVMKFVAKVIATRNINGRSLALSSGSIYDIKPTLHQKNLPVSIYGRDANPGSDSSEATDIVGYTCMEHDCLYKGYQGVVGPNDYVVFDNVGAYALVLRPPFIRASPAIIAYDSCAGDFEVVKHKETFADVFSRFVF